MYSGLTVPPSLLALADEVMNNDPFLLHCMSPLLAHRDKSQSPEFTVGVDEERTFVDKRSRSNLQRMTHLRHKLD